MMGLVLGGYYFYSKVLRLIKRPLGAGVKIHNMMESLKNSWDWGNLGKRLCHVKKE